MEEGLRTQGEEVYHPAASHRIRSDLHELLGILDVWVVVRSDMVAINHITCAASIQFVREKRYELSITRTVVFAPFEHLPPLFVRGQIEDIAYDG